MKIENYNNEVYNIDIVIEYVYRIYYLNYGFSSRIITTND